MEIRYFVYVIIGMLVLIIFLYNRLISLRNQVKNSFSGIDVQLKRRNDLIPNLVETVKGYAKHEKKLLENIAKERASIMKAIDSKNVKEIAKKEESMSTALRSLLAVSENYPDLKANENFLDLQDKLTKTEDQISASRRIYNSNVTHFNTAIEVFPNNIFANIFNFEKFDFFEIKESEKKNVVIKNEL